MKISWRLIVFGVVAYLVFLAATLPADFVLAKLRSKGVAAAGVTGTVWNGKAAALQFNTLSLGATSWEVDFFPLFLGRLSGDFRAKRDDGSASAHVSMRLGGRIDISGLAADLPVSAVGSIGLPGRWQGNLRLQVKELRLEKNWPTHIVGTLDAQNLVGPDYQPTAIGNYRVDFPGSKGPAADGISGQLASVGEGPLDVSGKLQLLPNRNYIIEAYVLIRPTAPPSITKQLQYLPPPDAQGRRLLSLSAAL